MSIDLIARETKIGLVVRVLCSDCHLPKILLPFTIKLGNQLTQTLYWKCRLWKLLSRVCLIPTHRNIRIWKRDYFSTQGTLLHKLTVRQSHVICLIGRRIYCMCFIGRRIYTEEIGFTSFIGGPRLC